MNLEIKINETDDFHELSETSKLYKNRQLALNRIDKHDLPISMNRFNIVLSKECDKIYFTCNPLYFFQKNTNDDKHLQLVSTYINNFRNERLGKRLGVLEEINEKYDEIINELNDNTTNRWVCVGHISGVYFTKDKRVHILRFDAGYSPRGHGMRMLFMFLNYFKNQFEIAQVDLSSHDYGNYNAYRSMGFYEFENKLVHDPNFKLDFDVFYNKCKCDPNVEYYIKKLM